MTETTDTRLRTFSCVPAAFWSDLRVSAAGLRVMGVLGMYVNTKTMTAWPTQRTLARATGFSIQTVKNALQELTHLGWVRREKPPTSRLRHGPRYAYVISTEPIGETC